MATLAAGHDPGSSIALWLADSAGLLHYGLDHLLSLIRDMTTRE